MTMMIDQIVLGLSIPIDLSFHIVFYDNQQQQCSMNNIFTYQKVNDTKTFDRFVKERFMQRSHLDMILNSNATRNEDRFNVFLLSWNKYSHVIKNKNTISRWNITDMISIRLKLYEIMNNGNLWDQAKLLYAISLEYFDNHNVFFPVFSSRCDIDKMNSFEKDNYEKG
ncbi:unnamed protein product [Cunninghamella blakesleeana]